VIVPVLLALPLFAGPYTDYRTQAPGVRHHITVKDLPAPYTTEAVRNPPSLVKRPEGALPKVPPGFAVSIYAEGFDLNRLIRVAPNGDLFVSESDGGRVTVLRGVGKDGRSESRSVFAEGLHRPFGIAFFPPGPDPQWVYVANTDSIVRFPYQNGDTKARGKSEIVVPDLPSGGHLTGGGHWTRDIAFSLDGKRLFISVGSRSNADDTDGNRAEFHRADILVATPEGKDLNVFASGLRNAVGLAVDPDTGKLWASVNERDNLGDQLPPDFITHVEEGGFYGWPFYYIGGHPDPRLPGKHPELKDKVLVPDVLLEPHNASLQLTFYGHEAFPEKYRGGIFAAEHGSWNRSKRTGYEVIFVPLKDGKSGGVYEDFMTGFVRPDGQVWGRPVGVDVGKDGSLFVSEDAGEVIWRVVYKGR
jgi:glucose/arabinose dehydrogenase